MVLRVQCLWDIQGCRWLSTISIFFLEDLISIFGRGNGPCLSGSWWCPVQRRRPSQPPLLWWELLMFPIRLSLASHP